MPVIKRADNAAAIGRLFESRMPLGAPPPADKPLPSTFVPDDVDSLLAGRASVRAFGEEPVEPEKLATILGQARTLYGRTWPEPGGDDGLVSAFIAAGHVKDVGVGIHRVQGSACVSADGGLVAELQRAYAAAPVLLLVAGRTDRLRDQHSAYGGLLVRASSYGYAVWLAALEHGLAASCFGRSHRLATRAVRSHDQGLRHLFTVAIGYPNEAAR